MNIMEITEMAKGYGLRAAIAQWELLDIKSDNKNTIKQKRESLIKLYRHAYLFFEIWEEDISFLMDDYGKNQSDFIKSIDQDVSIDDIKSVIANWAIECVFLELANGDYENLAP